MCVPGQERPAEAEGAELKLPEHVSSRRDSSSSLESTLSSAPQDPNHDPNPEQYEVIKQQKDIIQHGIQL